MLVLIQKTQLTRFSVNLLAGGKFTSGLEFFHNLSMKCSLVTLSIGTVGATIVHHPKWQYSTNSSLVHLQVSLKFDSLRMLDFLFDIYHQSSV